MMKEGGIESVDFKRLEMFFGGLKAFTFGENSTVLLFRTNNLLRTVFNYRKDFLRKAWRAVLRKARVTASKRRVLQLSPSPLFDSYPQQQKSRRNWYREVLIINSGAHNFKTFDESSWSNEAEQFWASTASILGATGGDSAFPDSGAVLFRTLYTGQESCQTLTKPFTPIEMITRHNTKLPYSWDSFGSWNDKIVNTFAPLPNFFVLNVTMFSARGDGRKVQIWQQDPQADGSPACCDCLHFAQPGPLNEMVRLMYHSIDSAFEDMNRKRATGSLPSKSHKPVS
jgi:hypothetical protein